MHDAVLVFNIGDEEHLRDHVALFIVCVNILVVLFDFGNLGIGVLCILADDERQVLLLLGSKHAGVLFWTVLQDDGLVVLQFPAALGA